MTDQELGWSWFDAASAGTGDGADLELCRACARCFGGADGERVIGHLTRTILERRLLPQASDAELRHLEGQRCAIASLLAMVERGRS
jgi:hypothetical protein